jgi:plasmid stabilization system protein ParE
MSIVVWTPTAKADLDRHYQFLAAYSPAIAAKAIQHIVKSGESLQQFPKRGTAVGDAIGLRKLVISFGKSGFVLQYTILDDEVVILRVYQGRENRSI